MYRKATHLLLFVFILFGCEKEKVIPKDFPSIKTLAITEISTDGARFSGELIMTGNQEIIEWGFVWSEKAKPILSRSEFKTLKYNPGETSFYSDIRSTLLPDVLYHVRAFATTSSYTVYGNEVYFNSKGNSGPEFIDFSPKKGSSGDTIRITGKYFSNRENGNQVKFDIHAATTIYNSDSLILALVPQDLEERKSKITVTVAEKWSASKELFDLTSP